MFLAALNEILAPPVTIFSMRKIVALDDRSTYFDPAITDAEDDRLVADLHILAWKRAESYAAMQLRLEEIEQKLLRWADGIESQGEEDTDWQEISLYPKKLTEDNPFAAAIVNRCLSSGFFLNDVTDMPNLTWRDHAKKLARAFKSAVRDGFFFCDPPNFNTLEMLVTGVPEGRLPQDQNRIVRAYFRYEGAGLEAFLMQIDPADRGEFTAAMGRYFLRTSPKDKVARIARQIAAPPKLLKKLNASTQEMAETLVFFEHLFLWLHDSEAAPEKIAHYIGRLPFWVKLMLPMMAPLCMEEGAFFACFDILDHYFERDPSQRMPWQWWTLMHAGEALLDIQKALWRIVARFLYDPAFAEGDALRQVAADIADLLGQKGLDALFFIPIGHGPRVPPQGWSLALDLARRMNESLSTDRMARVAIVIPTNKAYGYAIALRSMAMAMWCLSHPPYSRVDLPIILINQLAGQRAKTFNEAVDTLASRTGVTIFNISVHDAIRIADAIGLKALVEPAPGDTNLGFAQSRNFQSLIGLYIMSVYHNSRPSTTQELVALCLLLADVCDVPRSIAMPWFYTDDKLQVPVGEMARIYLGLLDGEYFGGSQILGRKTLDICIPFDRRFYRYGNAVYSNEANLSRSGALILPQMYHPIFGPAEEKMYWRLDERSIDSSTYHAYRVRNLSGHKVSRDRVRNAVENVQADKERFRYGIFLLLKAHLTEAMEKLSAVPNEPNQFGAAIASAIDEAVIKTSDRLRIDMDESNAFMQLFVGNPQRIEADTDLAQLEEIRGRLHAEPDIQKMLWDLANIHKYMQDPLRQNPYLYIVSQFLYFQYYDGIGDGIGTLKTWLMK